MGWTNLFLLLGAWRNSSHLEIPYWAGGNSPHFQRAWKSHSGLGEALPTPKSLELSYWDGESSPDFQEPGSPIVGWRRLSPLPGAWSSHIGRVEVLPP